jgi:tricorn protease
MAYSRGLDTRQRAIFLYDTEQNERHQVTAGFYDDSTPEFDPDGKYLYFRSGRTLRPVYSDQDTTWVYNNTTNIVAVPLRKDVQSPLHERNDDEETEEDDDNGDDDNGDDDNGDDDKGKKGKKKGEGKADDEKGEEDEDEEEKPEPVEIDLEGFEARLVVLPPEAGNYRNLNAVSGKLVYLRMPRTGSGGSDSAIVYYDLEEREEKTVLGSSDGFEISADGKKILVASNGKFAILDLGPDQKIEKPLRTEQMEMELDPPAEWRQIFTDAWRIERDFFYDPKMHGVDWDEMRTRYGKLLDDAVTRWDLNFIIGELIAELNASHAYRGCGDTEQAERRSIGMLGVDYTLENGAYRFAKIIDGAPWDSEVRSPLNEPGLEVNEGDYLLAVNDAPIDTSKDPWAAFEGLADKTVQLTINDKPTLEGSRKVLVKTLSSETRLRNLAWIESNRKKVDEATNGRVGYIYVPDTGRNGQTELVRMFQPQFTKDALIIDERFNNGGQIPTRFVELLARPIVHYWGVRDGRDWQWPPVSHIGPKTMLINQWSGSGGDAFPWYFKVNDLGPLIGMRTWGGLIGITGAPRLIDGGVATVPTFGSYGVDGEWAVEGHGIAPDIEVVDDPSLMVDGGDPQLERAIEEMLNALKTAPPKHPNKPPYPNRSK